MSFLHPRDPSIDVYNRPMPVPTHNSLEPLLQEEDEESGSSVGATATTASSESVSSFAEGHVDVYLRLRSPGSHDLTHRKIYESTITELKVQCEKDVSGRNKTPCTKVYSFTKVFEPLNNQRDVYHGAIKAYIENEEHAVFLTYGTSGSGKTYTLLGDQANPGIVPRAVAMIFARYQGQIPEQPVIKFSNGILHVLDDDTAVEEEFVRRRILSDEVAQSGTFDYEEMSRVIEREENFTRGGSVNEFVYIWVSFMEIYNERVYDLLGVSAVGDAVRPELKVISNKGLPYAKNLTHVYAKSSEDVIRILNYGLNRLSKGSTAINATSSRSHSLFCIHVIKFSDVNSLSCVSYQFGDLAGSERLKKTENVGDRLKEGKYINTSLLCLGKCLNVLHENRLKNQATIVPFRDSKLTILIQGALLGKENLILMVNLHPIEAFYEENQHVLEFSAIAREIVHKKSPKKKVKTARFSFPMAPPQTDTTASKILLDENYKLKTEYETLHAKNNYLLDENASLKLIKEMLDKEIRIRRQLIQIRKLHTRIQQLEDDAAETISSDEDY